MKRISIAVLLSLLFPMALSAAADEMLAKLDSVIDASGRFEKEKLVRIDNLRRQMEAASTDMQRYAVNSMILEEFKTYNVDSALKYAASGLQLAQKIGDTHLIAAERIRMSFVLAAGGLLKEAQEAILPVSHDALDRNLRKDYYSQMMYLFNHFGDYAKSEAISRGYYEKGRCYRDSIVAMIDSADADYPLYMGWYYSGSDNPEKDDIIVRLKESLDTRGRFDRDDARMAYILARLLRETGDNDGYVEYLAKAAVCDIMAVNRDIASLEDLAGYMYHEGDIDRAYDYMNYAINAAQIYPNRVRTVGLSRLQRQITEAWQQRHRRQESRIRLMLAGVAVLSLVLIAALAVIRRQMKRLRVYSRDLDSSLSQLSAAHDEVAEANERLNQLNSDLCRSNAELSEANFVKEEYIGYAFAICSGYISKLREFKKTVNRKCKARQYDDIAAMTLSSRSSRDDMKDFYRSFDTVFLNIYPTFVADFNDLLEPESRIVPRDGELLNTELRIYALVRLGISDSVKIAEFLQCSAQTVYNYRYSVRNRAVGDKENFAQRVKALGRKA